MARKSAAVLADSFHHLFLMGILATGIDALYLPQAANAQEAPRTDRYGDPLPKGAIGRIGTIRLLHGGWVTKVVFSPDGKILAGIGSDAVRLWDATTGKELRRSEARSFYYDGAFSANSRRLWLQAPKGAAFVWDLHAKPDRGPKPAPFEKPHTHFLTPSPDGKIVAAGDKASIRFWDADTGKEVRCLQGHSGEVRRVAFSADGKIFASSDGVIHLWDAATGRLLRSFRPTRQGESFTHFALGADGKTVAAANSGQDTPIRLWDAATGKEIRSILGSERNPRDVAFSPDGKILVLASLEGLRAWEATTGKQLWEHHGTYRNFNSISFSPDGKTLASGGGIIRLWKARTGEEIRPVPEACRGMELLALLSDRRTVFTGVEDGLLRLWRLPGLEALPLSMWRPKHKMHLSAAVSPDGKVLAWVDRNDGAVCLCDTSSAKILRRLPHEICPWSCHFSPDGKLLLARINQEISPGRPAGVFQLWDVESGKSLRRFEGSQGMPGFPAFSPDGKQLAVPADNHRILRIWAVDTGQEIGGISVPAGAGHPAFSFDGRLLAGISGGEHPLRLWEVASGKEIRTLHTAEVTKNHSRVYLFVLSPDNRRMIVSDLYGNLFCWDIRSGTLQRQWRAHASGLGHLNISADNRTLVSGDGTTALVWDLAELLPKEKEASGELLPAELNGCWADLKAEDATRAWRAVWKLSAKPDQAVAFLRERLRAAREPDKTNTVRIAQLIGDLDKDVFQTREKASRELATFGREAEAALRKALESGPSAESKRRIEELVRKLPESLPSPPPEQLRQLRALAVLEDAATPEAKKCLQTLTGGAAEARLTREAKAALDRLVRKSRTAP
jgi:WD40 repeat protein